MTTIYLIRHGEVYNPHAILYGRLNGYGLSEKGQEELEQTADYLSDKKIAALYASPMLRARQSAEIIQRKIDVPLTIADEIMEVKTSYQGQPFASLDPIQSEVYLKPLAETDETVEQVAKRMFAFTQKLLKKHEGKNIVLVSHGDPLMALKAFVEQKKLDLPAIRPEHYIQHGEVLQLTKDGDNLSTACVFIPKI